MRRVRREWQTVRIERLKCWEAVWEACSSQAARDCGERSEREEGRGELAKNGLNRQDRTK